MTPAQKGSVLFVYGAVSFSAVPSFQYSEVWNKSSKVALLLHYFREIRIWNLGIHTDYPKCISYFYSIHSGKLRNETVNLAVTVFSRFQFI